MPFAPVDPEIKEKVISAYLASKGQKSQNQILRELRGQGVNVSRGSVNNIVAAYKKSRPTINESSQLVNKSNSMQTVVNTETEQSSPVESTDDQDVNFENTPYIVDAVLDEMDYLEELDGEKFERTVPGLNAALIEEEQRRIDAQQGEFSQGQTPSSYGQVNISDNQYNLHEQKVTQVETEAVQNRPQFRPPNITSSSGFEVEEDSEGLGDRDQSLLVRWVLLQREAQRAKQNSLEIQYRGLKRERSKLEQEKRDLAPFKKVLPMAKSLVGLGLDNNIAESWLVAVSQTAQMLGLDSRSAAWKLSEEVREACLLGGVRNALKSRNHELEVLGIAIENRKEELVLTQTQLESTKLEVERNRDNLIVLAELLKLGPLDVIVKKLQEYDSLTKIITAENLRQLNLNPLINQSQPVVNQPTIRAQNGDNNQLSPVDQIWAAIEHPNGR
jgi:hypothetical protein